LERDGLACACLYVDIPVSTGWTPTTRKKTHDKVQAGKLHDIVIGKFVPILELPAGENKALLLSRNALQLLNLCLEAVNRVRGLHFDGDVSSSEAPHEDLHLNTAHVQ